MDGFAACFAGLDDPRMDNAKRHDFLAMPIGGIVNISVIPENWSDVLRRAASIRAGTVPPSVILRKTAAFPRQNAFNHPPRDGPRRAQHFHLRHRACACRPAPAALPSARHSAGGIAVWRPRRLRYLASSKPTRPFSAAPTKVRAAGPSRRPQRNRQQATSDAVLPGLKAETIGMLIAPVALLCTDASRIYAQIARAAGEHVRNHVFANASDSRLKGCMHRFRGVATQHLAHYFG